MEKVRPLADRVVVRPAAAETKTASGLFIPDVAQQKQQKGEIIAVGIGNPNEPLTVKVGDFVLYGKFAGAEIVIDGETLMIMRESDLLAII